MTPDIELGPITKRAVGHASVEIRSADSGWLVLVAGVDRPAGLCGLYLSQAEADALLMLLLTRMYKVSEADVEIALTTLASLEEGE